MQIACETQRSEDFSEVMLLCVTERTSADDIKAMTDALGEILG